MSARHLAGVAAACAATPMRGLVDLLLPEHCASCGAVAGHGDWEAAGPLAGGLRPWDRPHLCRDCARGLFGQPAFRPPTDDEAVLSLPVWAAAATSGRLTRVVGQWKYHGVRGLGWPLARALVEAAGCGPPAAASGGVLVPIPLHRSRQRARGFNQAALLARLAAPELELPVALHALRRVRATAQQARLSDAAARRRNLEGAFAARAPAPGCGRALLVDDLVTAGATAGAAAAALREAGWEVAGVLALGVAAAHGDAGEAGDPGGVDTPVAGS